MILQNISKFLTGKIRLVSIKGNSMDPTLKEGQVVWVDYSKNTLNQLKIGDIVLFKNPIGKNLVVKRIDKYEQNKGFWMRGDNKIPLESTDSEMFGHVKLELLKGKVLY